jgi:hypothetical protein
VPSFNKQADQDYFNAIIDAIRFYGKLVALNPGRDIDDCEMVGGGGAGARARGRAGGRAAAVRRRSGLRPPVARPSSLADCPSSLRCGRAAPEPALTPPPNRPGIAGEEGRLPERVRKHVREVH